MRHEQNQSKVNARMHAWNSPAVEGHDVQLHVLCPHHLDARLPEQRGDAAQELHLLLAEID